MLAAITTITECAVGMQCKSSEAGRNLLGLNPFIFIFILTHFISNQVKVTLRPISVKKKMYLSSKPLKHPESQVSMSSISPTPP